MDYCENVQIILFINVATILPPGGHNFGSHDQMCYNRMHVITCRIIMRADNNHLRVYMTTLPHKNYKHIDRPGT